MVGFLVAAVAGSDTLAKDAITGASSVPPERLGLEIPDGTVVVPDKPQSVKTLDTRGTQVVAKLVAAVGANQIVMLPDGQLVSRSNAQSSPTTDRFEAIDRSDLAQQIIESDFPGFRAKISNRYLFIYNTSRGFTSATSQIIESMLRGVMLYGKAQKIDVREPEVPLVVIMFRTEAEFQRHRRMPPGVVAYYDQLSNRVFLHEENSLNRAMPELATQQAISTIAHEGAHQILHNIGVQNRLSVWPMWLSEGLAEYFAPTSFGRGNRWKGAGQINDMRMFELENYLKEKSTGLNGTTVLQTVGAARLTSTGYASAWSLTHFLAKRKRVEFNKLVNELSTLGPFQGYVSKDGSAIIEGNLKLFDQYFGSDFKEVETLLVDHLTKQRYVSPFADFPHVVVLIAYKEGTKTKRIAQSFLSPASAEKWRQDKLSQLNQAPETRQVATRAFPNRATATSFVDRWLSGR